MRNHETFGLADIVLQEGATLRDAKLAYKTHGELNGDKSNAIVYPTWYSGWHWEGEWICKIPKVTVIVWITLGSLKYLQCMIAGCQQHVLFD